MPDLYASGVHRSGSDRPAVAAAHDGPDATEIARARRMLEILHVALLLNSIEESGGDPLTA
jgi:hypothetical protein